MIAPICRLELGIYSGPLDLLLYLVRKDEIDVLDIQITKITTQFQDFLEVLELINLDIVGDFLIMASTLIEIKSRLALPQVVEASSETEEIPEEAIDPRSDLVKQLLEYKRFKDASVALEEHAAQWQDRYPRLHAERPKGGRNPAADLIKDIELWDLVSALARVVKQKDVEAVAKIEMDETPIHVYIDQIGMMVREKKEVSFNSLFATEKVKSKIVRMFLAVLELLRHHKFRAHQARDYGDIILYPPLEESEEDELENTEPELNSHDVITEENSE